MNQATMVLPEPGYGVPKTFGMMVGAAVLSSLLVSVLLHASGCG